MPLAAGRYATRLRGELDWIVMRALAKSREERYPSASALAADIERYLEDRPVEAWPPSRAYQLRKFVKRNRAASAAVTGISLALVVGLVVSTLALSRAQQAEAEAVRQVRIAGANIQFLTSVLATTDAEIGRGEMTAREMLDVAERNVENMLSDDPEVRASVFTTIGRVHREQGNLDRASGLFEKAIAQFDEVPLEGNEYRISHTMNNLSTLERMLGNLDRALELGERSLEIRLMFVYPGHELIGRSYSVMGLALNDMGRHAEAEDALIKARDFAAGDRPGSNLEAWGYYFYGRFLREQGRFDEALANQERAREIFGSMPNIRLEYGTATFEAGLAQLGLNERERARALVEEGSAVVVESYQPHNYYLGWHQSLLSRALGELGEWKAALDAAHWGCGEFRRFADRAVFLSCLCVRAAGDCAGANG